MSDVSLIVPAEPKQFPPGPWKPGQSGNPYGRAKGSKSKLGEAFVADLYANWQEHGVETIEKVRVDDPAAYLRVIASIIPKEFVIKDESLGDLPDSELMEALQLLRSIGAKEIKKRKDGKVIEGDAGVTPAR